MGRQRNAAGRRYYHHDLLAAIGKCLPKRGLPLQVDDRRVRWTPRILVIGAVIVGVWRGRVAARHLHVGDGLDEALLGAGECVREEFAHAVEALQAVTGAYI